MKRLALMLLGALALVSCNSNANNVVLSSLDRSDKMQFICADLDLITGNFYQLKQLFPEYLCQQGTNFAPEVTAQFLTAVTQIQTGEVAVISFTTSAILDTNRTIPGVTALRVGEQPTGIQLSPFEPSYTYVSSFSPKSVQAIPTEEIVTGASTDESQQVRFAAGPSDLALHEWAELFSETTDSEGRIISANGTIIYRNLYAALPELGKVAVIPVVLKPDPEQPTRMIHGSLGTPSFIDLGTYDCATAQVPSPASRSDDYNRICPQDFEDRAGRFIKEVETTQTECTDGPTPGPRPVTLAIDYGLQTDRADDVLLVADANQPVIHRFSLFTSGATALDPIVVGTPTNDVAVTPFVPASSDPDDVAATERYLYAVSATDSSVLAVDYTPGSATFRAVLPMVAGISTRANEENVESSLPRKTRCDVREACGRPALRAPERSRRHRREALLREPPLGQPPPSLRFRLRGDEQLRTVPLGADAERAQTVEIARDEPLARTKRLTPEAHTHRVSELTLPIGRDDRRPSTRAEEHAALVVVKIDNGGVSVGPEFRAEPPEPGHRRAAELMDSCDVRVGIDQLAVAALHHERDLGVGIGTPQGRDDRLSQNDVADRAQPDDGDPALRERHRAARTRTAGARAACRLGRRS